MNLSIQEILTQAAGFILLVWILKKIAWKPLLELLEERQKKIAGTLAEIERAKEEVSKLKSDYEAHLSLIEEEARAKLRETIQEGKRVASEIQDAARGHAKDLLEKSKHDIELETEKAKVLLRKDVVGLVLNATEHVIRKKITEKQDEEMVLEFVKEIEASREPLT